MTLTWPVVAAVLFGALLHASWNALVKSSDDKALDTAVIHLVGSFIGIPLLLATGLPPVAAWPYIGASVVIHIAYYIALTGAYKHGDLGLTYPLMRGVGPVLVALSATLTLGESLTPVAWAGVLGVCGGLQMLGEALIDPHGIDGNAPGLGLLPLVTVFAPAKTVQRTQARFGSLAGPWAALAGVSVAGYEIHHGQTAQHPAMAAAGDLARVALTGPQGEPLGWQNATGNVLGVYLHGLFEDAAVLQALFGASVPRLVTVTNGNVPPQDTWAEWTLDHETTDGLYLDQPHPEVVAGSYTLVRRMDGSAPLTRVFQDHASEDGHAGWMPPKHPKDHAPAHMGQDALPPSLRQAIHSFVLACAAREARGQGAQHSSMLVHVTRYTLVQKEVHRQVEDFVQKMKLRITRGIDHAALLDELRALWESDFVPTTEAIASKLTASEEPPSVLAWADVHAKLPDVLSDIDVRMVNGKAKDITTDCSMPEMGPYVTRSIETGEWEPEIFDHEFFDSFPVKQVFKFAAAPGAPAVDPRGEKSPVLVSGIEQKDIARAINQVDKPGTCNVKYTVGADEDGSPQRGGPKVGAAESGCEEVGAAVISSMRS